MRGRPPTYTKAGLFTKAEQKVYWAAIRTLFRAWENIGAQTVKFSRGKAGQNWKAYSLCLALGLLSETSAKHTYAITAQGVSYMFSAFPEKMVNEYFQSEFNALIGMG